MTASSERKLAAKSFTATSRHISRDLNLDCTQSRPFEGRRGTFPDSLAFFKAIWSRFDGIGGETISIQYENHLRLFAFPRAVYFDRNGRSRVNHTNLALAALRKANTDMISRDQNPNISPISCQTVADMIVSRYAERIAYLASGEIRSLENMRFEEEPSIQPFFDYSHQIISGNT